MLTSYHIRGCLFTLVWLVLLLSTSGHEHCEAAPENLLMAPTVHVTPDETGTFGISLRNAALVAAAQIRLTYHGLPGLQITGVTLTSRTTGFEPPVWQMDAGAAGAVNVRVVVYSLHGAAILPGTGAMVTVHYQTSPALFGSSPLTLTETVLSDLAFRQLPATFENGSILTDGVTARADRARYVKGALLFPAIPEPATLGFWLLGLLLIWMSRRFGLSN